jgi:hypothetical protein
MKLALTLVYTTILILPAFSQKNCIKWDKNVKVAWSDFKGKADKNSAFAAMSAIGLEYRYNSWSNGNVYKLKFEINSVFDRSQSWSKRNLRTRNMLKHEQLHFDIGGLVSREFKKEAENKKYSKNYKNEIESLFGKYSAILQKFQQKYDLQTYHGRDKTKQKEWENLVHQELLK